MYVDQELSAVSTSGDANTIVALEGGYPPRRQDLVIFHFGCGLVASNHELGWEMRTAIKPRRRFGCVLICRTTYLSRGSDQHVW